MYVKVNAEMTQIVKWANTNFKRAIINIFKKKEKNTHKLNEEYQQRNGNNKTNLKEIIVLNIQYKKIKLHRRI